MRGVMRLRVWQQPQLGSLNLNWRRRREQKMCCHAPRQLTPAPLLIPVSGSQASGKHNARRCKPHMRMQESWFRRFPWDIMRDTGKEKKMYTAPGDILRKRAQNRENSVQKKE